MFKKIFSYLKIIFYVANLVLITLYIFPGSILGWFIYGDAGLQPQITSDFIVSSNHVYAFLVLSFFGFLIFFKDKKKSILIYFFSISFLYELLHIIIPNRSFQISDLYGNVLGVLISLTLFLFFYYVKKKV